jgi:branched-chain amino acid transport system substrate-binding protein
MREQSTQNGTRRALIAAAFVGLISAGTLAGVAGAQSADAPGVTRNAVKLGFISSQTGVASPTFEDSNKACEARVDAQNAAGGVHGRKIDLVTVDDQSSGQNLTAAQDLVQNRKVFAVINNSGLAFLAYRYLKENGVPEIGGGFDGNYYGEKGNEIILSALGNIAPVNGLTPDWPAKIAKQLGAKKLASISYSASPSGTASVEAVQKYAAPEFGLEDAYTNTTLEFGTQDVQPIVLGIKNSGADGLYLPLDNDTNVAIIQALQQNGVKMKANVLATGYSQQLLDQPVAQIMTPNDVLLSVYKPVELANDPAVKEFRANLKKYAGITGVPDYGAYTGYIACDMAITGLEEAGANPTRQGFVDGIRNLGKYDAAGLTCKPLQVGYDTFGKTPETSCNWFLIVEDGKFKVLNGGKPITSKLLGDPKLVAANRAGTATTTTTAPAG